MDEWVVVEDVITVMDKIKYNLEEVKKKNLTSHYDLTLTYQW